MRYTRETMAAALEAVRCGDEVSSVPGVPANTLKSWARRWYGSVAALRRKRKPITAETLPGEWR